MRSDTCLITNGQVLLPAGALIRADVRVADGRIVEIGAGLNGTPGIDAAGGYVVPGLIDLHTHGIGWLSPDNASLEALAAEEAAHGATRFYPTLFGPPEHLIALLERHVRESDGLRAVPQVGGFRLESPYLAITGAGVPDDLAPIDPALTARLLAAGGGHIRIWDLSPELPGAPACISALVARQIVCAMAHTHATIAQGRTAVDAGAQLITHAFDTFEVPVMTDPGVYPVGLLDYLLLDDRVTCEIIADGTHVPPLHVEKALRCKGRSRVAFITDSNYGAGLPAGDYDLPSGWGAVRINGSNDGVRLIERDMVLAGSALTPIDAFRNAIHLFGQSLTAAAQLCAATPARLLGLNAGEIAPGRDADLLILDTDLSLCTTLARGQVVFSRE